MFIKIVEVKNFRSIKNGILNCDDLTVIIGRNGSGKSTYLKAIEYFYDISANISEEDFYYRNIMEPIQITITYKDFNEEEENEFRSYIKDSELTVMKEIKHDNNKIIQKYYAKYLQIPAFADIRSIKSLKDKRSAWNEMVNDKALPGLEQKAKNADEVDIYMKEYEANYPELMRYVTREEQFFGPKNIGGGKLDNFTRYVYIPAVKEATDEISGRKGAIQQILDLILLRKISEREDIKEFKAEYEGRIQQLYCKENFDELSSIGGMITETLNDFAPGSNFSLEWEDVKLPEIPLPTARGVILEDNFEGDISRKGHGLQRAVIITLLQHLAIIENKKNGVYQGPDVILAIEEPELYLHPSRCRYLAELFRKLVKRYEEDECDEEITAKRNQIFITSHSPYFIELNNFDSIRLIRKENDGSRNLESTIASYSLKQASKCLAKINNDEPHNYTRDSFKVRSLPVMNSIVNEGFFADVVIVVEGLSDVGIIWKLQEMLGKEWHRNGIVVVPAGGVNNIDRPVIIFRGLNIPNYFIFDADAKYIGNKNKEKEVALRNKRYLRLAGAKEVEFPNTQVNDNWAVFADDIESEIKNAIGDDLFSDVLSQIAKEYDYDIGKKQICKNIEGASYLIETIYCKYKKEIPLFEEIINRITQLAYLKK